MEVNLLAVLTCGVFSMILGFIWFGPLFGKQWMKVIGADKNTDSQNKAIQKTMGPIYAISFVLALFQAYVLAQYINGWQEASGLENALWIWAAFIIPTVAGGSMWNNDSPKVIGTRFMILGGYYLILLAVFGLILGTWR